MSLKSMLRDTRAKIEDPANWIQNHAAQDQFGTYVNAQSKKATSFCLVGALEAVVGADPLAYQFAFAALNKASMALYGLDPITTNDHAGHVAVLATLDAAIEAQR